MTRVTIFLLSTTAVALAALSVFPSVSAHRTAPTHATRVAAPAAKPIVLPTIVVRPDADALLPVTELPPVVVVADAAAQRAALEQVALGNGAASVNTGLDMAPRSMRWEMPYYSFAKTLPSLSKD